MADLKDIEMSEELLQIDISKSKYNRGKDDLIKIQLKSNDFIEVNFSKLVSQSKYIRDKYKYSEALQMMQQEIDKVIYEKKINSEIIKHFIQLIQEEKVAIPIKDYQNFYILSEYFDIPIIVNELDNIIQETLFNDLNFTIQYYQNVESTNKNQETKLIMKIEHYLSTRINECLTNSNFSKIPFSTISRIIEKSSQEQIDHNLLIDFIIKSISTRFTLLRFVEVGLVFEAKMEEFINFIDSKEHHQRKIYLEYLPFSLSFFKKIKNTLNQKDDELNKVKIQLEKKEYEHNQTKIQLEQKEGELNQTKTQLDRKEGELNQTKIQLEQKGGELNQTKIQLEQKGGELNQTKTQLEQKEGELNQTKTQLEQKEGELNQTKIQLEQKEEELKQAKNDHKQNSPSIVTVGGYNGYEQFGKNPNNVNKSELIPPVTFQLDPSPLLSFSVYGNHSVLITKDHILKGVGYNNDGRISSFLPKKIIDHFTEFCIKDSGGRQLNPLSAVCNFYGTLYMFSKMNDNERYLVLCDKDINGGAPLFLDIGNHHPVSLFGGRLHSASITSEGEIIFINRDSVKNSPSSRIESVSLPDGEKASSVACCNDSVVVLSLNGRVFISPIESRSCILRFSEAEELKDKKIICLSGTFKHFLAVSKEGHVFGLGSNQFGKLGLGEGVETSSSFTKISSLERYEIKSAYAGCRHSLLVTRDGKILSFGDKSNGRLLLNSEGSGSVYLPTETTITGGATFCIGGEYHSTVFIDNDPPPNIPNKRIEQYK